ncbi:glycosyltransferase [Microbispora hainanensis]|uniref:glycosyltransferase n=1 Tax=Microbispora hainanensis TaxID=568844 RepID=UPI0033E92B69
MKPIASVVIPAFNEESALGRCLEPLLAGAAPGEFDVVVVPNGCTDGTAHVARRLGARVVEVARPGKANALRLGDAACSVFPRIYLDADVLLDTGSARALVAALEESGALAAAPVPVWDLSGAGRTARRVHHVHEQLLRPRRALAGVGVYALSRAGHARVFPIPDVVADDELVHRSFGRHERVVVADARSVVRPARTVGAHLRRRVRVRLGNRQLTELGLPAPEGRLGFRALATLVASGSVSHLDAACYLAVLLADRALTRRRPARTAAIAWSTDSTSR